MSNCPYNYRKMFTTYYEKIVYMYCINVSACIKRNYSYVPIIKK